MMQVITEMRALFLMWLVATSIIFLPAQTGRDDSFAVRFEQNGKQLMPVDGKVFLHPDTFYVVFEFTRPGGVFLNASFNPETYQLASSDLPYEDLPGFEQTGMSESLFNRQKEILISEDSPVYWYYQTFANHRFSEIVVLDDKIICRRKVEQLFDADAGSNTSVAEVTEPLYMVFVTCEEGDGIARRKELHRMAVEVVWQVKE